MTQELRNLTISNIITEVLLISNLLCFRHLSESCCLLGAVHNRSKCKLLSGFNAKPFVITTYAQTVLFYLLVFKKSNIFTFSHSKMNANYAEICRVDNLEAYFQQVPLVQFF